ALAVPLQPRLPPDLRPPAIAVHDEPHMAGQRPELDLLFEHTDDGGAIHEAWHLRGPGGLRPRECGQRSSPGPEWSPGGGERPTWAQLPSRTGFSSRYRMAREAVCHEATCSVGSALLMPPKFIGPYRVMETLGSGGVGTVYRALDRRTNDPVALKLLSAAPALDSRAARRLAREFETLADLSHPNVVKVFDVGVFQGYPYLVMELIEGLTLRNYLNMAGTEVGSPS